MCGGSGPLRKTKVEGARLKLCDDCQDVGEVVETPTPDSTATTSSSSTKTRTRSKSSREPDTELVEDYGLRVKRARESQSWSVGDLASTIKEKDSVIRRIESGKLSPDQRLARKLENALDITLYEELRELSAPSDESASPDTTIGDVAEVRERD